MKTLSKLIPSRSRSRSRARASYDPQDESKSSGSYQPPSTPNHPPRDISPVSKILIEETVSPRTIRQEKKRQERHHRKNVKRYRGFSTSISSLFLDEQVVCASISWCGLLASSRTEYLLDVRNEQLRVTANQRTGKSPSKALGLLLIGTVAFLSLTYLVWGFGDVDNDDWLNYKYYERALGFEEEEHTNPYYSNHSSSLSSEAVKYYVPCVMRICDYNRRFWKPLYHLLWSMVKQPPPSQHINMDHHRNLATHWMDDQVLASNLRSVACFLFFCILGLFGRRRRMQSRYAVLKARQQDDQIHFGGFRRERNQDDTMKREDKYAGACSHTLCGCYPVDRKIIKGGVEHQDEENDIIAPGYEKKHEDSVNASFNCIMSCCCGKLFSLWCQCLSICALAQEAREVRLLMPPKIQRVDLITHQPWHEYFKEIYDLRRSWKEKKLGVRKSWSSHFQALSTLSRTIVTTFIVATAIIIVTEQLNPRAFFSWADAFVLILTFVQSFIVLGKSELV